MKIDLTKRLFDTDTLAGKYLFSLVNLILKEKGKDLVEIEKVEVEVKVKEEK